MRTTLARTSVVSTVAFVAAALMAHPSAGEAPGRLGGPLTGPPIKHVVVIYQENHSFNDLLGMLCVDEGNRCAGSTSGTISTGATVPLTQEGDIPPGAGHDQAAQTAAIDGGKMDGWDLMPDGSCSARMRYACLVQVHAGTVPALWSLADHYAISDMTFESGPSSSWGSHLELVAATMDGFLGYQPNGGGPGGLGCDSGADARWSATDPGQVIFVPSCVPDREGRGPYRSSPVQYVPTIMDTLDAAGLSWNIFAPGQKGGSGYGWAICPTFFECLGSSQAKNVVTSNRFAGVAEKGKLPALSIVIPFDQNSQHNGTSLLKGDNWIAKNVEAVMKGPDWASTAIFITYDDCGCYYDPVAPPTGDGVRVPMVIVSPYAKPRFVDHTDASLASLLAFTEHVFGLKALPGGLDGAAYDYADAFDFTQTPRLGIALPPHLVPASSLAYIALHPPDRNDPT